jgi:hypothetical protein
LAAVDSSANRLAIDKERGQAAVIDVQHPHRVRVRRHFVDAHH